VLKEAQAWKIFFTCSDEEQEQGANATFPRWQHAAHGQKVKETPSLKLQQHIRLCFPHARCHLPPQRRGCAVSGSGSPSPTLGLRPCVRQGLGHQHTVDLLCGRPTRRCRQRQFAFLCR
jgi:hypothetical protein